MVDLLTSASGRHISKTAVQRLVGAVGVNHIGRVGDKKVDRAKVQLEIEIMVNHVHAVESVLAVQTWGPLHCAREVAVGGGEGSLPHLRELVHDVGNLGLVCLVVHKEDGTLVFQDHLRESRPVIQGHGSLGGRVDDIFESRFFNGINEGAWWEKIRVTHHEGDYIVGILEHPLVGLGKIGFQSAGIKHVAAGMAKVNLAALVVSLELNCL